MLTSSNLDRLCWLTFKVKEVFCWMFMPQIIAIVKNYFIWRITLQTGYAAYTLRSKGCLLIKAGLNGVQNLILLKEYIVDSEMETVYPVRHENWNEHARDWSCSAFIAAAVNFSPTQHQPYILYWMNGLAYIWR